MACNIDNSCHRVDNNRRTQSNQYEFTMIFSSLLTIFFSYIKIEQIKSDSYLLDYEIVTYHFQI